eukprot:SAG11_NODE_9_length_28972_cov_81.532539_18_plen_348_part_00
MNGESITTEAGRVVTPAECLGESTAGACLTVLCCPAAEFLRGAQTALMRALSGGSPPPEAGASRRGFPLVIVHVCPRELFAVVAYARWRAALSAAAAAAVPTRHVHVAWPVHGADGAPAFASSALLTAKLAALEPQFFPLPWSDLRGAGSLPPDATVSVPGDASVAGDSRLRIILSPPGSFGLDDAAATACVGRKLPANHEVRFYLGHLAITVTAKLCRQRRQRDVRRDMLSLHAVAAQLRGADLLRDTLSIYAASAIKPPASTVADGGGAAVLPPRLVFLGTGSANPSKYRNQSAIYLQLPDSAEESEVHAPSGVLLDAGEGCYGQLVRYYGAAGADDVLRGVYCE